MSLYTAIARCGICKRELNRAEHVPENERVLVTLTAPLMAICPEREHNSLSDVNWKVDLEWVKEVEAEP